MREKYIEEKYSRYHISGSKDDMVWISNNDRVIAYLKKEAAEKIINDRDLLLDKLVEMALLFESVNDEEFTKFWYGR